MFGVSKKEEIADASLGYEFVGDSLSKVNDWAEFLMELSRKDIILDR
jgi:hypothetical protein